MRSKISCRLLAVSLAAILIKPAFAETELNELIAYAVEQDAGKRQIIYQADAMQDMGVANSQWQDPQLKVGVGGLPVDSFSFDKDPMTNISVGLMQKFGRGDALDLQLKQSTEQADSMRQKASLRELEVANAITVLWIELFYQRKAQQTLEQNRVLFSDLEHYLGTNYGVGVNQAQDLIKAQLQVSVLDEKLQANQQLQQRIRAQLSEWLGDRALDMKVNRYPGWKPLTEYLATKPQSHYNALLTHPTVKMVDYLVASSETQVDIAHEAYKPQFGVEMMYGYRQANGMNGQPASDLVSFFLTMDIPLFTEKRQDKKLSSAQHLVGAAKSQRDLLLQQMNAKVDALLVNYHNLQERSNRYSHTLLKRAKERTQAVERGYQNNTSNLDEYIRAASEELNLALEQERLKADLQLTNSNLAFLLNKK